MPDSERTPHQLAIGDFLPEPHPSRLVIFKVASAHPRLASTRIRALLPALGLERRGYECRVEDGDIDDALLARADCLVLVKSLRPSDVDLACRAYAAGKPVILDVCDNMFFDDYGNGQGIRFSVRFAAITKIASAVVTTGPCLAAILRDHTPEGVPIVEIPDQLETRDDVEFIIERASSGSPPQAKAAVARQAAARLWRALTHPRLAARSVRRRILSGQGRWGAAADRLFRRPRWNPVESGGEAKPANSSQHGPSAPAEAGRSPKPKTLVWFGNHGADHGDFGMLTLLPLLPDLIAISRRVPIKLLVVSNHRGKFNRHLARLPFPSEYREWHPLRIFKDIADADLCLLPNSQDNFSICKSGNRATLSLSLGVPVVATEIPSLAPLAPFIALDDWAEGIERYLTDPVRRQNDVEGARRLIAERYSGEAISDRWAQLIENIVEAGHRKRAVEQASTRLLAYFNLVQDLDLLLPILLRAIERSDIAATACLPSELIVDSPRVMRALNEMRIRTQITSRAEIERGEFELPPSDAVLTASETTERAHRVAHAVVLAARKQKIKTYTLQHGIENIGLTYFDNEHDAQIRFASDWVFIWGDKSGLPQMTPQENREKCVPVGCPKSVEPAAVRAPFPLAGRRYVAIFENLHWHRYDDEFVSSFIADLEAVLAANPEIDFVVKPHHAGRWLTKSYRGPLPTARNLIIVDPTHPDWEPFTAAAFIEHAIGVVTTPSTVAFDAARLGKPVAIVAYSLNPQVYDPLPLLRRREDWLAFVGDILSGNDEPSQRESFIARTTLSGDAVGRILDVIVAGGKPAAP